MNVERSGVPTPPRTYQCAPPGGSDSGPRGVAPLKRRSGSSASSSGKRSCSSAPRPWNRTSAPCGSPEGGRVLATSVTPRLLPSPSTMRFEGIHHVTCITADAPGNVDFYARVLGLRLVKKSVNQDDPTVYHLFYGDERGDPGADITFFEYPGARRGTAGAGMVHRIAWRVASEDAIAFWEERLGAEGLATERRDGSLLFADPEGLGHE